MQITNEYVFDFVSTISARIVHQYEHLLYYAKSPHSWALPNEWQRICEKFPAIIRNKVKTTHATCSTATINSATTNPTTITTAPYSYPNLKACSTSLTLRVACNTAAHSSITTTTTTSVTTTTTNTIPTTTTSTCNNKTVINEVVDSSISSTASTITTTTPTANVTNSNNVHNNLSISFKNINNINNNIEVFHHESTNINEKFSEQTACVPATTTNLFKFNPPYGGSLSLNIKRKGFFNRLTYSIDEDGYEALMKTASPGNEQLPSSSSPLTPQSAITSHQNVPMTATSTSVTVTGGSGRLNNIHINRSLASIRTGPMSASPSTMSSSVVPLTESFTPHEANTRQKLLNKQIKIISDIMVESSKTGNSKSSESLKVATNEQKSVNDLNEDDDDTDVQFVAVSTAAHSTLTAEADTTKPQIKTPTTRPKLSYEYRSYSTCD